MQSSVRGVADARAQVLAGLAASGGGDALAVRTCLRHLAALGALMRPEPGWSPGEGHVRVAGPSGLLAECGIAGPAELDGWASAEAAAQARCGLMEVHGRQLGRPRPLGVEVASVTAGVLAVQGLLASLLAQLRGGGPGARFETSLLEAGLFSLTHYFASATCGDGWRPPAQDGDPGPPFRSADGHWFELEALDPGSWNRFWAALGVSGPEVGTSWMGVVFRYVSATSRVHRNLHAATARNTLREIADAARANDVSICRLRSYPEVVEAVGPFERSAPWTIRPGAAGHPAPEPEPPASLDLPLAGLRVVEITRRIQGPLAGLVLRMLGADVLRIEPPGGDPIRLMAPLSGDASARFLSLNRGKRVEEIDIKDPAGRRAVLELVAGADVFLQNWAPGRARAMGLDHDDLAAAAPRLVYGSISGWEADDAPPGSPIGTDFLVQAHVGLGDALNPPGESPFPSLATLTDVFGGLVAAEGVLGALVLRERIGRGARVDSSLHSAALELQAHVLQDAAAGRERDRDRGRPRPAPPGAGMTTDLAALAADPGLADRFEEVGGCVLPARPWRFSA